MRDKIGYYKNMSIRKQQNVKMQVFKVLNYIFRNILTGQAR